MNAVERIELSRERLRSAMLPALPIGNGASGADDGRSWLHRLKRVPLIGIVTDTLQAWWLQHPLRPVARLTADASRAVVKPLSQRHPIALVAVAGVAGAALAWKRPWRWILRSALFAGLAPQLASRAVSNLPLESWITMLNSAMSRPKAPSGSSAAGS